MAVNKSKLLWPSAREDSLHGTDHIEFLVKIKYQSAVLMRSERGSGKGKHHMDMDAPSLNHAM